MLQSPPMSPTAASEGKRKSGRGQKLNKWATVKFHSTGEMLKEVTKVTMLEEWRRNIKIANFVESSDSDDDAVEGQRKKTRLDGQLDFAEFEQLLMSSGGAAYGCDRLKMRALFESMDSCGEGKVGLTELLEVTLKFAATLEEARIAKDRP